jgi:hypothetical protein
MHIEAGQKSQTSRFLSVLVLAVMKQIGSKWIVFTNLRKCYFSVWPITADRRMLILCTQLNSFLFYALGIGWIELNGKNVGRRQLNEWNELKLSLLAHLCMVWLNWDTNPVPVLFTRPHVWFLLGVSRNYQNMNMCIIVPICKTGDEMWLTLSLETHILKHLVCCHLLWFSSSQMKLWVIKGNKWKLSSLLM